MSTVVFASKLQGESIDIEVDTLSKLAVGENSLTVATTMEVYSGADPNPTAMLSGSPSVSNNIAKQKVVGGLPGVVYQITFAVRTSNSQILLLQGRVAVLPSATITPP
jgi:hypothetical protein